MNQLTPTVRQMFALINDGLNCDHASATYCMGEKGEWRIVKRPYLSFCETFRKYYCVPAFTIEDMYQILPPNIDEYELSIHKVGDKECVQYENPATKLGKFYIYDDTRLGAVYTAIQHLIIDGSIKTTKAFSYDERIVPLKRSTTR
jgi:hypothetical protein